RKGMLAGVDELTDTVKVTLGPRGRHVVLAKAFGGPTVPNDGVSIARQIEPPDPFPHLGAPPVASVPAHTHDVAGAPTRTATLPARAPTGVGLRTVVAGASPMARGTGIERASAAVSAFLTSSATPVSGSEAVAQVATVSSRDPEIGRMVAEAMDAVGVNGVVSVEESQGLHTDVSVTEGVAFDKGYLSPYFVTGSEEQNAIYQDVLVLLDRDQISSLPDLLPLLEKVSETGKPLVIIAEDLEGEALSTLVVNSIRKTLKVVAIKAPYFGDRRKA